MTRFESVVTEHLQVVNDLKNIHESIHAAGNTLLSIFKQKGKILICGNGGSAANSQHISSEFMVRYKNKRLALPVIALTTDTSILTAHSNDFEYATVFSRQIEALGQPSDCLIAISTSGKSNNIIEAIKMAHLRGMKTIALTGRDGGGVIALADQTIVVPSQNTARIQEAHFLITHWWCQLVDEKYAEKTIK